jgi:ATP adenylyltransferase
MKYILAGSGKATRPGCFFCNIPNDEGSFRENLVVVVQPHAFVCLNRYPFTPAHLLVVPRRHVADLADLTDEEYGALMMLLRDSTVRLRRAVACEAMNVGFNLGKVAGGSVSDHVHGHIVPRWTGDVNFLPVLADVRVMPEHLDEAWVRLQPAFADLPGVRAASPSPDAAGAGAP